MRRCGIDLGSTNVKVVAVDRTGAVLARTGRPTPRVPDVVGVRTDADALHRLVEKLIIEAAQGEPVAAACVAGVGEDGVLVGANARPLDLVLPWFDPRRREVMSELEDRFGTGRGQFDVELDAARTMAGWAWLARDRPDAIAAATAWVALTDYPAFLWSGHAVMSNTLAARTAAWSIESGWAAERVTPFLGDMSRLPPVVSAGTVIGPLRSPRLAAAGIAAADSVVVAGGHDHPVAASVVHRGNPGAVLDSMGTAEVIVRTVPMGEAPLGCDISPAVVGSGRTVIRVVELDRNVAAARRRSPEVAAEIDRMLTEGIPQVDIEPLFVPGAQGGEAPAWSPAADSASDTELAAHALRACAELGAATVRAVSTGSEPDVYGAGGWTSSPGWMRLKESSLGRAYRIPTEAQLTAFGAAQLALMATGHAPALASGFHPLSRDDQRSANRTP